MTNETNRTKTKVSGIGKYGMGTRTLAIVLGLVMLLTAIGSGSVFSAIAAEGNGASVLLDAAKAGADVDAPADAAAADDKADAAAEDEAPLSKKADSDLADTGRDADIAQTGATSIKDRYGQTNNNFYLTGSFNSWSTNSSSWKLTKDNSNEWSGTFTLSGSTSYTFKIYCTETSGYYSIEDSGNYTFSNTWDGSSASTMYIATDQNDMKINTPTNGTYVINVHLWLQYGTNSKLTVSQKSAPQIKGDKFGSAWSLINMTYDSEGKIFKYTYTPSSSGDFFFSFYNPNDSKYYGPSGGNYDFTNQTTGYGCNNNDSNRFYVSGLAGGTYTIKYNVDTNDAWLVKSIPAATDYYLTGYVNGTDYSGNNYHFTGSGDNYTYTLSSTKASQYLTIKDNLGNAYHPGSHPAANGAAYTTKDTSPTADNKWGITSGANGKNITFTWKPTSKTLSWTITSGGSIDVYAKDGAAPINWDNKTSPGATSLSGYNGNYAYNYGIIATTTASSSGVTFTSTDCDIAGGTSGSKYQYGSVPAGQNITVTTTISSTYSSKYYVAGWCVNGVTYKNGTNTVGVNPSNTSSYSFTYTLPSDTEGMLKDVAGNPVVEITPIYYLKDKTNTVTFYLEGYSDIADKWGNTPYVYPFYGNLSGYQNTFGAYPGQPIVNVGGQMSIEVPIYTKPISVSVASTVIKGVTVSNGYADHVHRNLVYGWQTAAGDVNNDKDHMQTYDYDDFYKIWAERIVNGEHPNAIFFRIKEETKTYNRYTYGGGNSGQFATSTASLTAAKISAINSNNGWELMKDRHDRNVNIWGDYSAVSSVTPSSATADTSKAIYVVSTGYNANVAGDYGTMWKIYNGSNGELITKVGGRYGIPPSLLNLAGNASSGITSTVSYPSASRSVPGVGSYTDANSNYNEVYKALKNSAYTNKIVYITYEKDTQDTRNVSTGEGAYRLDGKWFYTHAADNVTSTIGIEYYNRSTGKWVADTVSNAGLGTTTKATAAFDSDSYASSTNKITSNSPLISANKSWNFTATESGTDNKYAFSGWYIQYDDTYEHVSGSTNVGTIKATANYHLIARYVPVVTNSLVITHKLDPTSTGTGEATMTVKYNNVTQTVNYVNGVANAEINVSWATSAKNIDVTLTAAPQNDGKVQSISVDDQISSYTTNSTDYTLPCSTDGRAVTRTLRFTDHDVYNSAGTSLVVTELDYVSKIDATAHYYEFTYNFTDRDGASKKYVTRGEITEDHYAEYVDSSHNVSDEFVKSRAPFESNFMKTLKIDSIHDKGYSNHTLTATANYSATDSTPVYDVKIKLPYNYRTGSGTASGVAYKKYNASSTTYTSSKAPFMLKANYDEFVTIGATESEAGAQTKVSKITDYSGDPNHTGNDFITAPNTLTSDSTTYYFKYWEIKRLADNDTAQSTAPVVSRVYFPDFNYRIYCDSYVEAVYTTTEADYWANVKANNTYSDITCSVLYLESSRNQWNMMNGTTSTAATDATAAADKIYNDFIFNYNYKGKENLTSSDVEIGMVLERVYTGTGSSRAWVKGSSNVTDMDSYRTSDAIATENKTAIANWLKNGGTAPTGCVKQEWDAQYLNNKNYTEQPYSVYSAYGQTVADHSISFATPSTVDEYVYRAWAYIKDKNNGNAVTVSDPAYFSMAFIASANYSE